MNFLKYTLLLAALFCYGHCHAQTFDTVHVDTPTTPSNTYVRIQFPHSGFTLTDYVQRDYNNFPPITAVSFYFQECAGTPGITYYDTTISLYVGTPAELIFYLMLDSNTTNSNCTQRVSQLRADTVRRSYPSSTTAVPDAKEEYGWSVYPNPVTDRTLHIETGKANLSAMVRLYSIHGQLLGSYALNNAHSLIEFPTSLTPGSYLLYISTADGIKMSSLITVQ